MKACFFATLAVPFLAFASGGPFKIMSYNIRHGVTSDNLAAGAPGRHVGIDPLP